MRVVLAVAVVIVAVVTMSGPPRRARVRRPSH